MKIQRQQNMDDNLVQHDSGLLGLFSSFQNDNPRKRTPSILLQHYTICSALCLYVKPRKSKDKLNMDDNLVPPDSGLLGLPRPLPGHARLHTLHPHPGHQALAHPASLLSKQNELTSSGELSLLLSLLTPPPYLAP
jgi:hypothetical protein